MEAHKEKKGHEKVEKKKNSTWLASQEKSEEQKQLMRYGDFELWKEVTIKSCLILVVE